MVFAPFVLPLKSLPHFQSPLDLILKLLLSICTRSLIIKGLLSLHPRGPFQQDAWANGLQNRLVAGRWSYLDRYSWPAHLGFLEEWAHRLQFYVTTFKQIAGHLKRFKSHCCSP